MCKWIVMFSRLSSVDVRTIQRTCVDLSQCWASDTSSSFIQLSKTDFFIKSVKLFSLTSLRDINLTKSQDSFWTLHLRTVFQAQLRATAFEEAWKLPLLIDLKTLIWPVMVSKSAAIFYILSSVKNRMITFTYLRDNRNDDQTGCIYHEVLVRFI